MPFLQSGHGLAVGGAGAQLLVTLQAALVFGGADIDLAVGEIGESGAVPHFQVGQHLGAAEVGGGSSGGGRGFLGEGGAGQAQAEGGQGDQAGEVGSAHGEPFR